MTRSTIGPIECQPTRSSRAIGANAICCASHQILEVARVRGARPRPWDRLEPDPAVRAAQAPQLALDHAPRRAQVQMPPALETAVVDLQATGLPAPAADAPAAPKAHSHHDAILGE